MTAVSPGLLLQQVAAVSSGPPARQELLLPRDFALLCFLAIAGSGQAPQGFLLLLRKLLLVCLAPVTRSWEVLLQPKVCLSAVPGHTEQPVVMANAAVDQALQQLNLPPEQEASHAELHAPGQGDGLKYA
ncbi:hypothetical protein WJX77_011873 [Trebouxia sp. C0004]